MSQFFFNRNVLIFLAKKEETILIIQRNFFENSVAQLRSKIIIGNLFL